MGCGLCGHVLVRTALCLNAEEMASTESVVRKPDHLYRLMCGSILRVYYQGILWIL